MKAFSYLAVEQLFYAAYACDVFETFLRVNISQARTVVFPRFLN